jgi:hypothetical protein
MPRAALHTRWAHATFRPVVDGCLAVDRDMAWCLRAMHLSYVRPDGVTTGADMTPDPSGHRKPCGIRNVFGAVSGSCSELGRSSAGG